jgi:hypothetical protein
LLGRGVSVEGGRPRRERVDRGRGGRSTPWGRPLGPTTPVAWQEAGIRRATRPWGATRPSLRRAWRHGQREIQPSTRLGRSCSFVSTSRGQRDSRTRPRARAPHRGTGSPTGEIAFAIVQQTSIVAPPGRCRPGPGNDREDRLSRERGPFDGGTWTRTRICRKADTRNLPDRSRPPSGSSIPAGRARSTSRRPSAREAHCFNLAHGGAGISDIF